MAGLTIAGENVMWGTDTYYARGIIKVNKTGEGSVYISKTSGSFGSLQQVEIDGNNEDDKTVTINATAYLKAVDANGYHFVKWLDGSATGSEIGRTKENQEYKHTFTITSDSTDPDEPVSETHNVYAVFEPNYVTRVTTSASPSEGGTAYVKYGSSFSGTSTSDNDGYGQTKTGVSETYSIKATANQGYHLKRWEATNGSWSTSGDASTTITVTTQSGYTYPSSRYPCTVEAKFERNFYIRLTAQPNNTSWGTVSASVSTTDNSETASQSRSYTLTATPKTNYHFVSWSKTAGDSDGTINGNTFTGKTSSTAGAYNNYTVTGNFAENFYATLNTAVSAGTSGTVTGGGTKNVETSGGACEFNLTAPAARTGYYFSGWTGIGIVFSSSTASTTKATVNASNTGGTSHAATYTAKANYAEYSRIITITASGTPSSAGDRVIFNVSGPATYRVSVPVGGSIVLKDVPSGTYTITPEGWSWNYNVSPSSATTSWSDTNQSSHTFSFSTKGSTKKHSEASSAIKP